MGLFAISMAILAGSALTSADAQFGSKTASVSNRHAGQPTAPGTRGLLAGGSDTCGEADVVLGSGGVFFDNSTATTGTQGQSESLCDEFGTRIVINDVWFEWTPDFTGDAQVDTCDSFTDTKIAAYPGSGCPTSGTALACSDDSCGYQSLIQFPVVEGNKYMIQVGTYPFASGGTGMLYLGEIPSPQCPVMHDGVSENTLGLIDGGDLCYMYYVDCLSTIATIEVAFGSPVLAPNIAAGSDVTLAIWDDPTNDMDPSDAVLLTTIAVPNGVEQQDSDTLVVYEVGEIAVTGGTFVGAVVTHLPGEYPATLDTSNSGFGYHWTAGDFTPGGFDFAYLLNNDSPPVNIDTIFPGAFLIQVAGPVVLGLQYCPGDGVAPHTPCPFSNNNDGTMGGCFWGNAAFPGGGTLNGAGTPDYAADDATLTATNVENDFGIFFAADDRVAGGNGNPLNDGLRCADGGLIRLSPPTVAAGNVATLANVATTDPSAAPGVTRRYQYWFRTPAGPGSQMANLTNGYEITWL